jgi:PKHD-type hydroxylase
MYFDIYQILDPEHALQIGKIVDSMEWKQGQARTQEATGTVKRNLEIKASDSEEAKQILRELGNKIVESPIRSEHFLKKSFGFKFNKYTDTGEYQRHGDAPIMGGTVRTDLACTLSLSDPSTYKGGDLCYEEPNGEHTKIRLLPGQAVVYPCHMPHWVEPVTEGSRISAITWFESMFRDVEQRNLVRRFNRTLNEMEAKNMGKEDGTHVTLGTIYSRLIRMWCDYE